MTKQIAFIICSLISVGIFAYTLSKLIAKFKITKPSFPIDKIGERISLTLLVAFGQSKILRRPVIGMMHALVWWGFIVVTIGTAEIALEGFTGLIKPFSILGPVYDVIIASGDVSAALILVMCTLFLIRRYIMKVKRFDGIEIDLHEKIDAAISLFAIMFLMASLLFMNLGYIGAIENGGVVYGSYPISSLLYPLFMDADFHAMEQFSWWAHILAVFAFANYLPYSKHFHVFMSVPNVFMSRLEPLTKMKNMEAVTNEVKMMMDPNADPYATPVEGTPDAPARFGVKDIEDVSWTSYVDSLACTHCGRCTDVCPANTTGKKLSPRKILVDLRSRMDDKGLALAKDENYTDNKALVGDYISHEELWACTTCNACAMECPLNIDQPSLILDMRRYLVMEESAAPASLNVMMTNIENNGAPWAFGQADRMKWADNLEMNS